MNIGDQEYFICERHNAFSYRADDECDECKIAQLEAENARLNNEVVKLREELTAVQVDAARYRWLRDACWTTEGILEIHWSTEDSEHLLGEELDAAIDKAMKENEK